MRRFYLQRTEDVSGTSGTGRVAEGCQFSNGYCALMWNSALTSMTWFPSIDVLIRIHGHGGKTVVVWIDEED